MNNDLNKNVLQQYVDEIQSMTKEIENNLLKIQNDQIKLFKNNLNNISNNCISDIQLLLNKTNSKVRNNLHNNTIDNELINDFQFQVQAILLQVKNDLDTYKNSFDLSVMDKIDTETIKLKKFISENHGKIEEELHEALYQINQSENSALNRLEETYDLGVETIVSAERTALKNLKILSEELSLKLESKVEEIENVIHEKLQNALDNIKKIEENALTNITKLEFSIKNELITEKENIISELKKLIEDFEFTLQGYVDEMKAELTAHKDQLINDILINKEEILIELDKVKNSIIESLREKEYEFIQEMNNRAQELISEIFATVEGFDLELEIIKNAKIKEFTEALNLIKENFLKESIDLIEDCLVELKNSTEIHKEELITATSLHLIELRNKFISLSEEAKVSIEQEKNNKFKELENKTEDLKASLTDHKNICKDEMTQKKESLVIETKQEIKDYVDKFRENSYSTELLPNETIIRIDVSEMQLNHSVKVYIDGILQILNKHYELNFKDNLITLLEPFPFKIDVLILQNLPVTNFPKREATNTEIDNLFEKLLYIKCQ